MVFDAAAALPISIHVHQTPRVKRIMKNLKRSYMDRHKRLGQFRTLWITRINAAAREYGPLSLELHRRSTGYRLCRFSGLSSNTHLSDDTYRMAYHQLVRTALHNGYGTLVKYGIRNCHWVSQPMF